MHSDPSEERHEQPRRENASGELADSGHNQTQGKTAHNRGHDVSSSRRGETSGTERFCALTIMEGPVTALPIIPMKIRGTGSPFCSSKLLDGLGVQGNRMRLKLTTMDRTEDVDSIVANGLVVSDLTENTVIPYTYIHTLFICNSPEGFSITNY